MSALRAGVPTSSTMTGSTVSLRALEPGWQAVVVAVDPAASDELGREGIIRGAELVVAARAPYGGPTIIVLGRARLALSADLAAGVEVERLESAPGGLVNARAHPSSDPPAAPGASPPATGPAGLSPNDGPAWPADDGRRV